MRCYDVTGAIVEWNVMSWMFQDRWQSPDYVFNICKNTCLMHYTCRVHAWYAVYTNAHRCKHWYIIMIYWCGVEWSWSVRVECSLSAWAEWPWSGLVCMPHWTQPPSMLELIPRSNCKLSRWLMEPEIRASWIQDVLTMGTSGPRCRVLQLCSVQSVAALHVLVMSARLQNNIVQIVELIRSLFFLWT